MENRQSPMMNKQAILSKLLVAIRLKKPSKNINIVGVSGLRMISTPMIP